MRIVLLGPPGCGKGTQAARLVSGEGLLHLSTGDLLRAEIAAGSALGKEAKAHVDAGRLVPDDLVIRLVKAKVAAAGGAKGLLFDGFPRTVAQADALDAVLGEGALGDGGLDAVVSFVLGDDLVVKRLLGRGRADDTEPVIRERLRVYRAQTAPLIERYRKAGLLAEVDGSGTVDEVADGVRRSLASRRSPARGRGSGAGGKASPARRKAAR